MVSDWITIRSNCDLVAAMIFQILGGILIFIGVVWISDSFERKEMMISLAILSFGFGLFLYGTLS